MDIREIIAGRRDGLIQSRAEFDFLTKGAADHSINDYQLAAWLMAAYLRPLSDRETSDLTLAMAEGGQRIDLTGVPKPWVDKHSTGGVGDKTTLVLAPLLAACGLTVVKMSGRGLGITGGTLDKLTAIPGMTTDLDPKTMIQQANRIGIAVAGQTAVLAPADKVLYALRDVTGTVASLPLIVSSILSKKIAGGAQTIVLDVKCGSGSFNPTIKEASALADALVRVGKVAGLQTYAAITDMDQPLGRCVGNALEVAEAIEVLTLPIAELHPNTARFRELCRYFAAVTLRVSGNCSTTQEALARVDATLSSGRALQKAQEWITAQGATVSLSESGWLATPAHIGEVHALVDGCVSEVNAKIIGEASVDLGSGRKSKNDAIDLAVGVEILVKIGDFVRKNDVIGRVHASSEQALESGSRTVLSAIKFSSHPVPPRPILLRSI